MKKSATEGKEHHQKIPRIELSTEDNGKLSAKFVYESCSFFAGVPNLFFMSISFLCYAIINRFYIIHSGAIL